MFWLCFANRYAQRTYDLEQEIFQGDPENKRDSRRCLQGYYIKKKVMLTLVKQRSTIDADISAPNPPVTGASWLIYKQEIHGKLFRMKWTSSILT